MSAKLKQVLRTVRSEIVERGKYGAPVTFLHDPDDGKPFAAVVTLEALDRMYAKEPPDPMDHDHIEGDEDE